MQKKVAVVGGGIIGLSSAYYLQKAGHEVILIDKGPMNKGASYVNAGYLTPSHIVPLAAPGMITKGLKWMFDSSSPFYIQPRLNLNLMNWGIKFMRSCTQKHVQRSMPIIRDINLLSKELFHELNELPTMDFQLEDFGLLMAFQTAAAEKEESEVVREAKQLGLSVELIDRKQITKLQPDIEMNVAGAYHYRCDAHSTPGLLMEQLKQYLQTQGVCLLKETSIEQFECNGRQIRQLKTTKGNFVVDEVVVAAGVWSQDLLRMLNIRLPIQAGKGYRLNEYLPTGITRPAILMERKVAVTPMRGFTRFSGTMEIGGIHHAINPKRVASIATAVSEYYPSLDVSPRAIEEVQCGLRPLSPDGLPFIGRHSKYNNLSIATGHAMMGWSLGPATGKLISELISGQKTSLDLRPYAVQRSYG